MRLWWQGFVLLLFGAVAPASTASVVGSPVVAVAAHYRGGSASVLRVGASHGVFANDTGGQGHRLRVVGLNGEGGTAPFSEISADGAMVTLRANGSFTYDPSSSTMLQALVRAETVDDTFTYIAADRHGGSADGTVTITLWGANKPPVLADIESGAVSYAAGTPAVPVISSLAVADSDDERLARATVSIGTGFVAGEDSLVFARRGRIVGSYDATTGVLTLTGRASLAEYQAALQSVRYSDSNGASPTTGARTIDFQVDDGHLFHHLSNVVSRAADVYPITSPIAVNDTASTTSNTAIDIPVPANDSDPDGDVVTSEGGPQVLPYSIPQSQAVPGGQLITMHLNSVGAPQALVCDGSTEALTTTGVDAQIVNLQLNGCPTTQINPGGTTCPATQLSPPSCLWEFTEVNESSGYDAGEVPRFDSGVSRGSPLLKCTSPDPVPSNNYPQYRANGTFVSGDPRLITIFVVPDNAYTSMSHLLPVMGYAEFYVTGWDHDPCAAKLAGTTGNGVDAPNPGPGSLSGYFIGLNRSMKAASVDTTGTKGSVSINPDGTIHYDPDGQFADLQPGQTATDSFTYTATDGYGDSNPATVTITING
jgi:VCBS repeat-containing protein